MTIKRKNKLNLYYSTDIIIIYSPIADGQESACKEVADFATGKIFEIESKIRDLTQMQEMLKELQALCMLNKNLSDCPIIESLKKES